jgi:thiol-disulfide isomerase/thioredoxin
MIKLSSLLFCLFIVGTTSAQKTTNGAQPEVKEIDYHQVGSPMPTLRLIGVDSLPVPLSKHAPMHQSKASKDPASFDGNLIVMIFNPTCGHCEEQADRFVKSKEQFKKSKVLLIANPVMMSYLPDFIKNHHINDNPFINVGVDSAGFIDKVFLYSQLPQINVYDRDRKLLKLYTGDVAMDSLAKYID